MSATATSSGRLGPGFAWALALAALVLLIVDLISAAHALTEYDSYNLAAGFHDYNPSLDQPHPPGYPLVVLSAHGLGWLGDTIDAYLAFAFIASVIAVVATYALGRAMFGARAGLSASLYSPERRSFSTTRGSSPSTRPKRRPGRSSPWSPTESQPAAATDGPWPCFPCSRPRPVFGRRWEA